MHLNHKECYFANLILNEETQLWPWAYEKGTAVADTMFNDKTSDTKAHEAL